jgi:hypothetical protein
MRKVMSYVYLAGLCLLTLAAHGQSLTTYDSFNGSFINPDKWLNGGMCYGNGYDCAREVRDGHLRLATRAYGGRKVIVELSSLERALGFPFLTRSTRLRSASK